MRNPFFCKKFFQCRFMDGENLKKWKSCGIIRTLTKQNTLFSLEKGEIYK